MDTIFNHFIETIDLSFKWILIILNFITVIFVYVHKKLNPKPRINTILFVIAHPDDETMFYRPTISSLKQSYYIHLLCLTGKGSVRQDELRDACKYLGVDQVKCLGQKFIDGMDVVWDQGIVRQEIQRYVLEKDVKAIFTFDRKGVSGHINHSAIYNAVKYLQVKPETQGSIKVYYLESVNLLRKYSGVSQIIIALLKTYSWIDISPIAAYKAMSKHLSQFLWYRRIWVFLSRYAYVNTYQRAFIKFSSQDRPQKTSAEIRQKQQ